MSVKEMSEPNWEARGGLDDATVTLHGCKETNEISPKNDKNFTAL